MEQEEDADVENVTEAGLAEKYYGEDIDLDALDLTSYDM